MAAIFVIGFLAWLGGMVYTLFVTKDPSLFNPIALGGYAALIGWQFLAWLSCDGFTANIRRMETGKPLLGGIPSVIALAIAWIPGVTSMLFPFIFVMGGLCWLVLSANWVYQDGQLKPHEDYHNNVVVPREKAYVETHGATQTRSRARGGWVVYETFRDGRWIETHREREWHETNEAAYQQGLADNPPKVPSISEYHHNKAYREQHAAKQTGIGSYDTGVLPAQEWRQMSRQQQDAAQFGPYNYPSEGEQ